ncbi:polysaccharide deacetylase family protein [Rhodobium gokarnense]|uniref:Peptidoglycan/xylan/chitin deacetylase (PgdA/CDA1 family) n=1 Tax=Rhodobium gokarnense TaxID=364296 RepID=A0ABT3HBT7_9HYPH|nr:polysaccharide deacetylase family protein [Rhodobium gokarnense]MCW2307856.1 peptidoglycan/xylan/chitin deacetylase (PgdA/CDA1 family) [Rhodobium gokarnense]
MSTDEASFAAILTDRLDKAGETGTRLSFWWRDDDAVAPSPALDRLLALRARFDVPLALAVIPEGATQALAERLASEPAVAVLQHGWAHANHQPAGEKNAELGNGRPADKVLAELARGRERLSGLFGDRFRPVLVPPWNRIAADVADRIPQVGLTGLSTFARADGRPHRVNTHLDPVAWKTTRSFAGWDDAAATIAAELDRRIAGDAEPFGLLTHHLVHDAALWRFVEVFLEVTARHPAVTWPDTDTLFGL